MAEIPRMLEVQVVRYGDDEDQFFRLIRPVDSYAPTAIPLSPLGRPVAVLIHGGFWKQKYTADNALIDALAPSLCEKGLAVVVLEYRRGRAHLDGGRGGWPETNVDLVCALQTLGSLHSHGLNLDKVVLVGHSAGATLALWPCCEGAQSPSQTVSLSLSPLLCVALAPIGDLVVGFERKLSDNHTAVRDYLGGPPHYGNEAELDRMRERGEPVTSAHAIVSDDSPYRLASPSYLLPLKTRCLIVAGGRDEDVPADVVTSFHALAEESHRNSSSSSSSAVPTPELLLFPDADHYQLVDSAHSAWQTVLQRIVDAVLA